MFLNWAEKIFFLDLKPGNRPHYAPDFERVKNFSKKNKVLMTGRIILLRQHKPLSLYLKANNR